MRWYLSRTGTAEGPFEEAALVAMIRGGQVAPNAQICPEGGSAWQALASHPPFAQAAQPARPAQPAAPGTPGVAATVALDSAALGAALSLHGVSLPGATAPASPAPGGFAPSSPAPGGFAPSSAYGSQPGASPATGGVAKPSGWQAGPAQGAPGGFAPSSAYGSQPGAMPSAGGFAPPGVAPGAPKKNNLPLIIGGGCALLMALSMCIVFGFFVLARM